MGYNLTIPMPGHAVGGEIRVSRRSHSRLCLFSVRTIESTKEKVKEDVETLHELIRQHDAIFLLTDSRESRWLPTVLAAVEQKVCVRCPIASGTVEVCLDCSLLRRWL